MSFLSKVTAVATCIISLLYVLGFINVSEPASHTQQSSSASKHMQKSCDNVKECQQQVQKTPIIMRD